MKRVLVVYVTNAGSTTDVAKAIGEELSAEDISVDVCAIDDVQNLASYDAVIVGAPMILGWHRSATNFLKKNQQVLKEKQVAYFFTAMNLTQTGEKTVENIPIFMDPDQAVSPKNENHLSLKEAYSKPSNYLTPVLKAAPQIHPASVGFFGGKLELFRLPILQMLFVMLIIQAKPGDFRHWPVIREWAGSLRSALNL
jgi:menaquinone-dependent protoporphyrinogen IX oxidase